MDRLVDPAEQERADPALRPRRLDEFVGQSKIVANLRVYIRAALERGEALDHVLLAGPPGLGKTSLAYILAEEMGVPCRTASGPAIERGGDLAAILTNLEDREVLFIDEIHRLNRAVEEVLYPAMEDFEMDVVIGQGPGAQSVKLPVSRFTLVGATTRSGMLTAPLRARFGIHATFDFYSPTELARIVRRQCRAPRRAHHRRGGSTSWPIGQGAPRGSSTDSCGGSGTSPRSRGTAPSTRIWPAWPSTASRSIAVGLDKMDRRILHTIAAMFSGGPVGLDTLAAAIGESRDTIEETCEPFLIQQGFLQRTPRGRIVTPRGAAAVEVSLPSDDAQETLL